MDAPGGGRRQVLLLWAGRDRADRPFVHRLHHRAGSGQSRPPDRARATESTGETVLELSAAPRSRGTAADERMQRLRATDQRRWAMRPADRTMLTRLPGVALRAPAEPRGQRLA